VKKIFRLYFLMLLTVHATAAAADNGFVIDHHLSRIEGAIKYSVVGTYRADFEDFSGTFVFDEKDPEKSSVNLEIDVATLRSAFPALDKIVLSKQLLDVEKFPKVVFKSTIIKRTSQDNVFDVEGTLALHGVTKIIKFPFTVNGPFLDHNNYHIEASGTWLINRKDFNIYWHPFLDKAGILVGNHLTVDWKIIGFEPFAQGQKVN
jgi:polyisoprenoid-binding protein YceI